MEVFEFPTETIAEMKRVAELSGYSAEAYEFVAREISRQIWFRGVVPEAKRGVSDQELCWQLHDRALLEFKDNAVDRLAHWNVHSTKDFGRIVYGLVSIGFVSMQEGDAEEKFDRVFDFNEEFDKLHFESMPLFPTRWRVSALLAVMTVVAIAFAGISKRGIDGALGTLLSAWLVILGIVTIYLGISNRSKDWLLAVVAGVFITGIGMMGFVLMTN